MADVNDNYGNLQYDTIVKTDTAASVTPVVLAEANDKRRFMTIYNGSPTATLFVDFGDDGTVDEWTCSLAIQPRATYFSESLNTGLTVRGAWSAADPDAAACVREYN